MGWLEFQVELSETNRQLRRIADALELLIPRPSGQPAPALTRKIGLSDVSNVDPARAREDFYARLSERMNPLKQYASRNEQVGVAGSPASAETATARRESAEAGISVIGEFDNEDPLDSPDWIRDIELGNTAEIP